MESEYAIKRVLRHDSRARESAADLNPDVPKPSVRQQLRPYTLMISIETVRSGRRLSPNNG